jgi:hypothetical protein
MKKGIEPYEIVKHDSKNLKLYVNETKIWSGRGKAPPGAEIGKPYVKKTFLGYYQRLESVINAIMDDKIAHLNWGDLELDGLVEELKELRKEVANLNLSQFDSLKPEKEWP